MAHEYSYAIRFSTDKMIARAYKDFTLSVSENYAKLLAMVSEVINRVDAAHDYTDVVRSVISEYPEFNPNTNVPLNDGVVSLWNYLGSIASSCQNALRQIDQATSTTDDPEVSFIYYDHSVHTSSLKDVVTSLNSAYHAVVVDHAFATGYDLGNNASEVISIARDTIHEKFVDAYTDVSNCLESTAFKVKSGIGVVEYVKERMLTSGLQQASEDGTTFDQSYDYLYSGATPASAYSFYVGANKFITIAVQAVQVIATCAVNVIKAIYTLAKNLVTTVYDKIYQVELNPYDIDVINKNGNNTIDVFFTNKQLKFFEDGNTYKHLINRLRNGPIHYDLICGEIIYQYSPATSDVPSNIKEACQIIHGIINDPAYDYNADILTTINRFASWLNGVAVSTSIKDAISSFVRASQFSTYFPDYVDHEDRAYFTRLLEILDTTGEYQSTIDILIKPKPLDYKVASLGMASDGSINAGRLINNLSYMIDTGALYLDASSSESDLYKGFAFGAATTMYLGFILEAESRGVSDTNIRAMQLGIGGNIYDLINYAQFEASNKDFFMVASQCKYNNSHWGSPQYVECISASRIHYFADILENIFAYRDQNPFDFPFWPYTQNAVKWFESSYRIKTDAENISAFENFVTTVIIVTVVVYITVKVMLKLKAASRKAMLQEQGALWNATESAAKGTLTDAQIKAYKKAAFKNKIMSFLAGNTMAAATSAGTTGISNVLRKEPEPPEPTDLSPVIELIRGY